MSSTSLITNMVTCPSNGREQGMNQEEFTAILIEKLNQVKRDREVRESLEDALRQFQECEPWWIETKALQPKTNYSVNRNSISPDQQQQQQQHRKQQMANVRHKTKKRKRRSVRNAMAADYRNGYRDPRNYSSATQRPANCAHRKNGYNDREIPEYYSNDVTVVGYCISGNPVPYTTKVRGKTITLGQFKNLLNRKGCYRYFFKKYSNEFGTNIVFEEVFEDQDELPLWEDKIFALVEEIEEFCL